MIFSNSISALSGNVTLNNIKIDIVESTKFLGLIIDNKLLWKQHTTNFCKSLSRNVGVINKIKCCFPSNILLNLYNTLILPYLNYGILAWGNSSRMYLDRILVIQKRIIRIINHTDRLGHTDHLFYSNNVLKIYDLYHLRLGCFLYQLGRGELPTVLSLLFSKNVQFHSYPTRQLLSFHLPLLRTLFKQRTIIYTGPHFFNSLDESFKLSPSLFSFKRKLKSSQINNYNVHP